MRAPENTGAAGAALRLGAAGRKGSALGAGADTGSGLGSGLGAAGFGTAAAELIKNKKYGYMVALKNNEIVPVPLSEVAGKLKTVPPDCSEIKSGREIGICFGD